MNSGGGGVAMDGHGGQLPAAPVYGGTVFISYARAEARRERRELLRAARRLLGWLYAPPGARGPVALPLPGSAPGAPWRQGLNRVLVWARQPGR
jgi:hypothetical protein